MTYSRIVYGLLTHIRQQKTIHIKLPVSIIDAKTTLSFSTLHKLHHNNYFINGLFFHDHILKFHDFFMTCSARNSQFRTLPGLKNQKMYFRTFQDPWEPCSCPSLIIYLTDINLNAGNGLRSLVNACKSYCNSEWFWQWWENVTAIRTQHVADGLLRRQQLDNHQFIFWLYQSDAR